jgi:hypothetical protein
MEVAARVAARKAANETKELFDLMWEQGASVEAIQKRCLEEFNRRRAERLRTQICAEQQIANRQAWQELRENQPQVDHEIAARQRWIEKNGGMIAARLWSGVWEEEILPRVKGVK